MATDTIEEMNCQQGNIDQLQHIERLKRLLMAIREDLFCESAKHEQYLLVQSQSHLEQIENKDATIERLQTRMRQLELENQQLKYQNQQRIRLMGTLKRHSTNILNQLDDQKRRHRANINILTQDNQALRMEINYLRGKVQQLEDQLEQERRLTIPKFNSSSHLPTLKTTQKQSRFPHHFYTVQKLHSKRVGSPNLSRCSPSASRYSDTSIMNALNDAPTVSVSRPTVMRDWKESRVTLARGKSSQRNMSNFSLFTREF